MRAPGPLCAVFLTAAVFAKGGIAFAAPTVGVHVEAAAARPLDEEKSNQFSWGGAAVVAPEVAFHKVIGLELAVGAIVLSSTGDAGAPVGVAETEMGVAGFATLGPRIRPLATLSSNDKAFDADGLWITGGLGGGLTGDAVRPMIRAAIGYDVSTSDFAAGPFVGYFHMIEPDAGSLRPEDARIAIAGLHGSILPASRRSTSDADTDDDGIPDASDRCVERAEDKDGFQDEDGCPDADNDGDGIPDAKDACRQTKEDKDGFQDEDGCPDLDNDGDSVPDASDPCPDQAEDKDGFLDDDGCPDLDNDSDGILDAADACALEAETVNGIRDEDGCPDTEDLHVNGDHIVLDERVEFATQSAEISKQSWDLLSGVAEFISSHPEYARIHVSGHADDTGTETFNQRLSQARAESVKSFLGKMGVASERLEVSAFGESKPLEAGTTAHARAKNRRVEFVILERVKRSAP